VPRRYEWKPLDGLDQDEERGGAAERGGRLGPPLTVHLEEDAAQAGAAARMTYDGTGAALKKPVWCL
jgi:hypothetical protein